MTSLSGPLGLPVLGETLTQAFFLPRKKGSSIHTLVVYELHTQTQIKKYTFLDTHHDFEDSKKLSKGEARIDWWYLGSRDRLIFEVEDEIFVYQLVRDPIKGVSEPDLPTELLNMRKEYEISLTKNRDIRVVATLSELIYFDLSKPEFEVLRYKFPREMEEGEVELERLEDKGLLRVVVISSIRVSEVLIVGVDEKKSLMYLEGTMDDLRDALAPYDEKSRFTLQDDDKTKVVELVEDGKSKFSLRETKDESPGLGIRFTPKTNSSLYLSTIDDLTNDGKREDILNTPFGRRVFEVVDKSEDEEDRFTSDHSKVLDVTNEVFYITRGGRLFKIKVPSTPQELHDLEWEDISSSVVRTKSDSVENMIDTSVFRVLKPTKAQIMCCLLPFSRLTRPLVGEIAEYL